MKRAIKAICLALVFAGLFAVQIIAENARQGERRAQEEVGYQMYIARDREKAAARTFGELTPEDQRKELERISQLEREINRIQAERITRDRKRVY